MKKLLYASFIALAAAFAASCQQEHIEVVYDPSKVTAQTLGDISDFTLEADGSAITTTFNPADYNLTVASVYTLYASISSDMADKVKVSAGISVDENNIGHITIKQSVMNSLIYALGGAAGEAFTVYFQLEGGLKNDKEGTIAATAIQSNIVSARFVAYSTIVKDVDLYAHVWVIGASAEVGAWSHEKVYQYLYDYDKGGHVYTGLIDFGTDGPSGGFKLTGIAGWQDDVNWGSEAQAEAPEQGTVQLIAGGGSKDIKCYSHRFYFFSFDSESLVFTAKYGFDNVGIVGAFNGWKADDAGMKMNYNAHLHRFWIDQTFADHTELKFTCDDRWDLNWGGTDGTVAGGGANIAVEAGSYRVYLDINKGTYELSSSMFGKDEPGGDEGGGNDPQPVVVTGWNIIGLNGDWDNDVPATRNGNVWTAYVNATADTEFKWRKDGKWDENYGGVLGTLGVPFAAVAGGDNIKLSAGFYKVELDTDALTISVSDGEVWSLIGDFNGWAADVDMVLSGGKWVSPVTKLNDKGFKIRHNHDWARSVGGTFVELGKPFAAVSDNGPNIMLPSEGQYIVTFDPAAETILVEELGWGLVGSMNGWSAPDIILKEEGLFLVARNVALSADDEFKLRYNQDWALNRGGLSERGTPVKAVPDGTNIKPGVAGSYDIYYRPDCEVLIVNPSGAELQYWGVVGTLNNWAAPDAILYLDATGRLVSDELEITATDEIKLRLNEAWDVNRGGTFVNLDEAFDVQHNGPNIKVGRNAKVSLVYAPADETITLVGSYTGE